MYDVSLARSTNFASIDRVLVKMKWPLCLIQAELLERKTFLSDAKEALLGARNSLDGRTTKDKMSRDERTVRANSFLSILCYRIALQSNSSIHSERISWMLAVYNFTPWRLNVPLVSQEMRRYRSNDTFAATTELDRENTDHILDQQARVRVSSRRSENIRRVHALLTNHSRYSNV